MTYNMHGLGAALAPQSKLLALLNGRWEKMAKAPQVAYSLASLAVIDQALALLHQAAHWQSSGPSYYGDHLLFQKLYKPIDKEVDALGERAVGVGHPRLVCPITQASMAKDLLQGWGKGQGPDEPRRLVQMSLGAERSFLEAIAASMVQASPSDGVQNLLQGIADVHEGNVYLLQQRLVRGG